MEDHSVRTNSDSLDVRHMLEIFSERSNLMERHPMPRFLDAMQKGKRAVLRRGRNFQWHLVRRSLCFDDEDEEGKERVEEQE
jgi:hypothetical protein